MSETRGSADTKIAMMRAAYEAWPDLDTYLREFRDDAVWHSPFAGDVSGKQAIRAYLSKGLLSVEEWTFEIHDIVGNEEHTVVLGRNDVRFTNGQVLQGLLHGIGKVGCDPHLIAGGLSARGSGPGRWTAGYG